MAHKFSSLACTSAACLPDRMKVVSLPEDSTETSNQPGNRVEVAVKSTSSSLALVCVFILCLTTIGSIGSQAGENKGKYADVNGLKMYYEIHGTGRPLVLLHGALSAIDTSFGVDDIQKAKEFHGPILGLEAKRDV